MTKFCDGCPVAGTAQGEIIGKSTVNTAAMLTNRWGFDIGRIGVLFNSEGETSQPLVLSADEGDLSFQAINQRLANCTRPDSHSGSRLFIDTVLGRPKVTCPALGDIALDPTKDGIENGVAANVLPGLQRIARSAAKTARHFR